MSSNNTDQPTLIAKCACDAVHFTLSGLPEFTWLCNCNDCRRSSGSIFVTHCKYPHARVRISKGEEKVKRYYGSDEKWEEGWKGPTEPGYEKLRPSTCWCDNCGTTLAVELPFGWIIKVGTIDVEDPETAKLVNEGAEFRARTQTYTIRKPSWAKEWHLPEGHSFERMPPTRGF